MHSRRLPAVCALLLLCACGASEVDTPGDEPGSDVFNALVPAHEQRTGDAAAGKVALTTQPIVSCGIPLRAYRLLPNDDVVPFPSRTGIAAELPYDSNLVTDDNGVQLVASNCLSCHGATLFGELVVGLGNEFLDFTEDVSARVEAVGALLESPAEISAWEKFADRIAAIAPYMRMRTAGVNPANNLTFALMAHRDPKTNAWLDSPSLPMPSTSPPPVSVPPWWRMAKKHAMFNMAEGRGDHARIMISAAILCTDDMSALRQLDALAADIRAYIISLQPPAYPFPINQQLAGVGQGVFEQTCSVCHGTYGDSPGYPNRLVPIEQIGTDAALVNMAMSDGQAYVDWFNASFFGELASAEPVAAYVAPPLDGIWSTAPFLHNGSVPTVRALLDSSLRPRAWRHAQPSANSPESYNQRDLGWHYVPVGENEPGLESDARWVYDTSWPGYGNTGHTFGDALTQQQRNAVIEYLKTL